MPPRHAYWTILIDDKPTAFRAREREELQPTLVQLQRKNENVSMRWFARGKLWASREAERDDFQTQKHAASAPREPRDGRDPAKSEGPARRGSDWRPGGTHKDPRDRFKKKNRPERAWSEKDPATQRDRDKPGYAASRPREPRGDRPWNTKPQGAAPSRDTAAGPPRSDRPWTKPGGTNKPAGGAPRRDRPWSDKPPADAPRGDRPWQNKPRGDRPWSNKPPGDRPWSNKPTGDRPRSNKPHGDRPRSDKPPGDAPRGDRPWSNKPPGDRPWSNKPPGDRPRGNKPPGDDKRPWSGNARDRFGAARPPSDKSGEPRRDPRDNRPNQPGGADVARPRERKPWSDGAPAPPNDRPWQTKPTGPRAQRKPWAGKGGSADASRGNRPWSGKPPAGPPRGDRPWSAKPLAGPPRGDRPWSARPPGPGGKRPWTPKPDDRERKPSTPRGPQSGATPGAPRKKRDDDPDRES